ncbi:cationic peroxidase 1-like [Cryptomeria japonica]|uniref:cationic peroxidase 1-like n=1 Tax=Cryptomeria japonica TaxID=3369 RepID=UPI0027DAA3AE|nr:cationic peroxidase 1-like [Cryptomeria japonica]
MTVVSSIACILLILLGLSKVNGQLNSTFYDNTCPNVSSIVQAVVKQAIANESRIGASLLRLHFHDCFVNGCDGSILLDDSVNITGEKTAGPNNNSVRGFDVIDTIKSQIEAACSGVVSCADILAITANFIYFVKCINLAIITLNKLYYYSAVHINQGGGGAAWGATFGILLATPMQEKPEVVVHDELNDKEAMMRAWIALILLGLSKVNGQLNSTFYDSTCPNVSSIVQAVVKQAIAKESRMGASLLRLHFHDCFVNGCDGSILLDDSANITGEKTAGPNNNSVRGFDVIDTIKSQVEAICSGVVSCADIVAIAARDSVVALGGPTWTVQLGRRDSLTANLRGANSNLPGPAFNLSGLISAFSAQGLSTKDMIALSGAHTIGQARCTTFRTHIYNDTNINITFASSVQANCPFNGGDNNLSPLDLQSPTTFDSDYYKNLISQRGLFHSDQELFNGGSAHSQVTTYANNQNTFFNDFAAAMVNMGNISPLTGSSGQVRKNCRKPN